MTARAERLRGTPGVELVESPRRLHPGAARNRGLARVTGDVVACLDADCVPDPDWIERVAAAMSREGQALGGAVLNATGSDAVGWAYFLSEFAPWLPGPPRALADAPTCNTAYRRGLIEAVGGLADADLSADSLLHWTLRARLGVVLHRTRDARPVTTPEQPAASWRAASSTGARSARRVACSPGSASRSGRRGRWPRWRCCRRSTRCGSCGGRSVIPTCRRRRSCARCRWRSRAYLVGLGPGGRPAAPHARRRCGGAAAAGARAAGRAARSARSAAGALSAVRESLSVVVTTYDRRELLGECLAALEAQTRRPDEVVVVDDASPADDASWARARFPWAQALRLERNLGHAGAAAAGLARARGELVALLNNDTAPDPDWCEQAALPFADPGVGSVATRLVLYDEPCRIDSAGDAYTVVGGAYKRLEGLQDPDERTPRTTFSACAAAVVYRRASLEACGGFDPLLTAYYDDVDLGFPATIGRLALRLPAGGSLPAPGLGQLSPRLVAPAQPDQPQRGLGLLVQHAGRAAAPAPAGTCAILRAPMPEPARAGRPRAVPGGEAARPARAAGADTAPRPRPRPCGGRACRRSPRRSTGPGYATPWRTCRASAAAARRDDADVGAQPAAGASPRGGAGLGPPAGGVRGLAVSDSGSSTTTPCSATCTRC